MEVKKINKLVKNFNEWEGAVAIWFDAETGRVWLNRYPSDYCSVSTDSSFKYIFCLVQRCSKQISHTHPLAEYKLTEILEKHRTKKEVEEDLRLFFMLKIISTSSAQQCKAWLTNDNSIGTILNLDGQFVFSYERPYEQKITHEILIDAINKRVEEVTALVENSLESLKTRKEIDKMTSAPASKGRGRKGAKQKAPEGASSGTL